ncbi:MAG: CoA pyrophosphatase [Nitrososphaerota archaeon]|nr:CoA pyrophosphatase [Nitrososphaerota archaeon]MDG6938883.1 CoA pyrophosphatase [Nitrososphaerota archaeon]
MPLAPFPAESLKRLLSPVSASPAGRGRNDAAVLVLLRANTGACETLLVRRAMKSDDPWSGQVAFPGGRYRSGDETLARTACREFAEETNADACSVSDVLGYMEPLTPSSFPSLRVYPFVGLLREELRPSPSAEIVEAFWMPLEGLVVKDAEVSMRGTTMTRPACTFGGRTIWGLTLRILEELARTLPRRP